MSKQKEFLASMRQKLYGLNKYSHDPWKYSGPIIAFFIREMLDEDEMSIPPSLVVAVREKLKDLRRGNIFLGGIYQMYGASLVHKMKKNQDVIDEYDLLVVQKEVSTLLYFDLLNDMENRPLDGMKN